MDPKGIRSRRVRRDAATLSLLLTAALAGPVTALTVEPPFDADYTLVDLGAVDGLPLPNGGLTFMPGDPQTILIGGEANYSSAMLYTVRVVRDADLHITGFAGSATAWAAAPFVDGGVIFGPGEVLFHTRFPENQLGQIPPGESTAMKIVDLAAAGVTDSPGGLNFVPAGFPGAGHLKLASWRDGAWYTLTLADDGSGTFDVVGATLETSIGGGPEGFVYIPAGSPQFDDFRSMLVSEWTVGEIATYAIDDGGNPIPATRSTFVSGLDGALGAAIDPLTGDFLFSTFSLGSDNVIAVQGFAAPPEDEPEPDPECESDSRSAGPGYWHRQCLGLDDGGFRPGRRGRGPALRHEAQFADSLLVCSDAWLASLGFAEATCEAIEARPADDPCERAMARLAVSVLDACSGRVPTGCAAEPSSSCSAVTVGERIVEAAEMIRSGACHEARMCLNSN